MSERKILLPGSEPHSGGSIPSLLRREDFEVRQDRSKSINMIKAFDESFASGEDSMTYDSGYWTTYDSEICDYESDSERNKVLIAVDVKED